MRVLVALALLAAWPPGGPGAGPRIGVVAGAPACVSCDRPGVAHVEPILAAHPADPQLLFGAAVTFPEGGGSRPIEETTVAGFRSTDGGRSWVRMPFTRCLVDPWVSFGKGFDLYLSCLARGGAIAVHRSADGGATWGPPALLPRGGGGSADHPILAVDTSAGPRGGTVYVAFGQVLPAAGPGRRGGLRFGTAVASSSDGGRTFSAPVFLRDDGLNQQPFDAAVLGDGTLVVLFMDYASRRLPLAPRAAWAARSADGGRSFTVSPLPVAPPGRLTSMPLATGGAAGPLAGGGTP
ncbi:MAG: exo-alpha-sialidase, partial [Acidobacteria bacterium]|nr:exo-alpha-sialidase [Acidobacteriota bacterium]